MLFQAVFVLRGARVEAGVFTIPISMPQLQTSALKSSTIHQMGAVKKLFGTQHPKVLVENHLSNQDCGGGPF